MKTKSLDPGMLQALGKLLAINRNSFSLYLEFDQWLTRHRDKFNEEHPFFDWENEFEDNVMALEKIQFEILHCLLYDDASQLINKKHTAEQPAIPTSL